jgi:hypothetical protein
VWTIRPGAADIPRVRQQGTSEPFLEMFARAIRSRARHPGRPGKPSIDDLNLFYTHGGRPSRSGLPAEMDAIALLPIND